ncbi:MAG: hypothetical protein ACXAAK_14555, partial [Candidatus Thorarchaeota archaeon]
WTNCGFRVHSALCSPNKYNHGGEKKRYNRESNKLSTSGFVDSWHCGESFLADDLWRLDKAFLECFLNVLTLSALARKLREMFVNRFNTIVHRGQDK